MKDFLANLFQNRNRYRTHSEAVVISCFYNPQNNPYRLLAFQKWYRSIKHLNHRIVECLIGPNAKPQLPDSPYITRIHTNDLLWHKETILNKIIAELPAEFQYVFWVDADVLFTNKNWLVDGVKELKKNNIIQPFEYCYHLEKNKLEPTNRGYLPTDGKTYWRSFAATYVDGYAHHKGSTDYNQHGHVGFAWGARREILDEMPLYDKALIGGADHIMAHAAVGHVPHECIRKSFTSDINEVESWSKKYHSVVDGKIGYVKGELYHIWHGDTNKRQYLKRIKDFTPTSKEIQERDANGLYVKNDKYIKKYYKEREVGTVYEEGFDGFDAGFYEDMGYMLSDLVHTFGQSTYEESQEEIPQQEQISEALPFDYDPAKALDRALQEVISPNYDPAKALDEALEANKSPDNFDNNNDNENFS